MARLTWLAAELRKAGLKVVEVDGWETRGSSEFVPIGVTWHATAGSRSATAQGEVNVILNGSTSAPPPIAQIMAWRDGTLYICAAGRCNHNKVGWGGPNEGLGNSKLLGIEMANDNRGEPWPPAQLDAVRRATAVIMRQLGADPMRRLAAHYEHQPYPAPPGETSTKSDPFGVRMTDERPRVAAIMKGDDVSVENVLDALETARGKAALYAAVNQDRIQAYNTNPDTLVQVMRPSTTADNGLMTWGSALTFAVRNTDLLKALGLKLDDKLDAVLTLLKAVASTINVEAGEDDSELATVLAKIDQQTGLTIEGVLSGLGTGQSLEQAAEMIREIYGPERAAELGEQLRVPVQG